MGQSGYNNDMMRVRDKVARLKRHGLNLSAGLAHFHWLTAGVENQPHQHDSLNLTTSDS